MSSAQATQHKSWQHVLALKVKDLDAAAGRRAEPVAVRGEDESVDDVTRLKGVEVLAIVEVPQHCDAVLSTRGGKRAIGRDGDSVDVTLVSEVVRAELAFCELPDLKEFEISNES